MLDSKIADRIADIENLSNVKYIVSGGEGSIYSCTLYSTRIALKIFHQRNYLTIRSDREINALATISSEYLPTIYFHGDINIDSVPFRYVGYEFIEGMTLHDLLKTNRIFSVEQLPKMIIEISKAIDALWDKKIIHCDVKPQNIMYDSTKNAFILIDMGLAKHLDASTHTQVGTVLGTLGYISPESRFGRKSLTLRSDYFSLGIISYQILFSDHPCNFDQDRIFDESYYAEATRYLTDAPIHKLIKKMLNPIQYKRPLNSKFIENTLEEMI